jgi:hypothetical protein
MRKRHRISRCRIRHLSVLFPTGYSTLQEYPGPHAYLLSSRKFLTIRLDRPSKLTRRRRAGEPGEHGVHGGRGRGLRGHAWHHALRQGLAHAPPHLGHPHPGRPRRHVHVVRRRSRHRHRLRAMARAGRTVGERQGQTQRGRGSSTLCQRPVHGEK